jgi:hypothetical protein
MPLEAPALAAGAVPDAGSDPPPGMAVAGCPWGDGAVVGVVYACSPVMLNAPDRGALVAGSPWRESGIVTCPSWCPSAGVAGALVCGEAG